MPRFRVRTSIIHDWCCVIEAENEQEARDIAYDEAEVDIGPDHHVEISVRELTPPYPMCRTPDVCAGVGYCERDPACNE